MEMETPRRRVAKRRNKPVPQVQLPIEDLANDEPPSHSSPIRTKPPSPYIKMMAVSPQPQTAHEESAMELEGVEEAKKEDENVPAQMEGESVEDEQVVHSVARPRKKKHRSKRKEAASLSNEAERWSGRAGNNKRGLGMTHAAKRRRMEEYQRQERQEGKMSGISLSLPRSFASQQTAEMARQYSLKKLRSHSVQVKAEQESEVPKASKASSILMKGLLSTELAIEERQRLCKESITTINEKIEVQKKILFSVDASLLDSINEFVRSGARTSSSSSALGNTDDLDDLLASLLKPAKLEIPTALLFVGVNVPDHDRLFKLLVQSLQQDGHRVASLRSKDCKMMLKPIIKSIVTQFIGSDPSFPLTSGKSNMRMLQHWYKTQGCRNIERSTDTNIHELESYDETIEQPLVVLVEDFEAFPGDLLKELISIFGYYQTEIPFVLIFGLATSADALHRALPRSVSVRLATRKFAFHSSRESFEDIFKQIVVNNEIGMHMGFKPVNWIRDSFYTWNLSIQTLQRELQLAVIEHFWDNELGFLCRFNRDEDNLNLIMKYLGPRQLDCIRRKSSVVRVVSVMKKCASKPSADMINKLKALKQLQQQMEHEAASASQNAKADPEKEEETASRQGEPNSTGETDPITKKEDDSDTRDTKELDTSKQKSQSDSMEEVEAEAEDSEFELPEDANEADLISQDDDYLKLYVIDWVEAIRRYHRNLQTIRECAVLLIAKNSTGTIPDDLRTDVFLASLPDMDFFKMMRGKKPPQRLGQTILPVRSAFVNSQLFRTAMEQIKLNITELDALRQILVGFEELISTSTDFLPFDIVSETTDATPDSVAPETVQKRSSEDIKQALLVELRQLIERLAARVDVSAKQSEESAASLPTSASSTPLRRSGAFSVQASPFTPRAHLKKGTSSKRIAAWMENWMGDIEQQLKQDVQNFLIRFFSSQLPAYCVFPLYEVFYYNKVDELEENFNAAPLTTVKDALSHPEDYLHSANLPWPENEQIDVALLFELYQGAGRLVNLKDLFDAFCERLRPGFFTDVPAVKKRKARQPKKPDASAKRKGRKKGGAEDGEEGEEGGKQDAKDQDKEDADASKPERIVNASLEEQSALLSRFLAAIGELQTIGFVCPPASSRRMDVLVKMCLGGRTA